jgi:type II secretory pathway pseudopilin PulG
MVSAMLVRKSIAKMSGITLLETMLALALGIMILMSVVIFYQSTRQSANVSKVLNDMNAIKAGYKAYLASGYKLNATSDAAQLQAVQDAGFLPNPLNNPWGQAYVVSLTRYPGYIMIAIPGLGTTTKQTTNGDVINDVNCNAIWATVQTTGGFSTTPAGAGYNCAFSYRFP